MNKLPTIEELLNPVLKALHELGGSGSIEEINQKVIDNLGLSEELLEILHNSERKHGRTEFEYRMAWSRSYLKYYGVIENSTRGIWSITLGKQHIKSVEPKEVTKFLREEQKKAKLGDRKNGEEKNNQQEESTPEEVQGWQVRLRQVLTQVLDPAGFERLVMRLLRESGFVQVEVTGRSGDGGIDGKGIARINGLLSFHVIFQCKRYQGSVTANQIRDFRGAMVGRADKGLFVTTGAFTRDAVKEATRDGAPPIDLIDGDQLAEKLRELSLGVETKKVETVEIDEDWFRKI